MHEVNVEITVNGEKRVAEVEARLTLADFLRERCSLTGTHLGCEHGVCGACTVLLDGEPVRACLVFAVQAVGEVTTIEGLSGPDGELSPVQRHRLPDSSSRSAAPSSVAPRSASATAVSRKPGVQ